MTIYSLHTCKIVADLTDREIIDISKEILESNRKLNQVEMDLVHSAIEFSHRVMKACGENDSKAFKWHGDRIAKLIARIEKSIISD